MNEPAPQESPEAKPQPRIPPVDKMAFAQLSNAVRQSGLPISADAVNAVRDNEFRGRRYQKAFDVIEGLYMRLGGEASRRQADLRRQELQYKSGAIKMTPKEWMLRQRRETEKTQRIEHARRLFTRILDGLSVMRAETPEPPVAEERAGRRRGRKINRRRRAMRPSTLFPHLPSAASPRTLGGIGRFSVRFTGAFRGLLPIPPKPL